MAEQRKTKRTKMVLPVKVVIAGLPTSRTPLT